MFDLDRWQEIFNTLLNNKFRTLATAFGVFWGILMLVLLLGAGKGLENGVTSSMILDATNSIWFFAGRTSLPYKGMSPGRALHFTEEDLQLIQEQVSGFELMSPENELAGVFQVGFHGNFGSFQVLGTDRDYFKIKIYQEYRAGRKLNLNDNLQARKVCVIGDRVAEVLFTRGEDPIGQYILIKDVAFRVVGMFHDEGWGGQFSERVYLPFSTFQRTFNPDKSVTLFAVTTREGVSGKALEKEIMTLLAQKHLVHPDDNQAFWSHNQEEQYLSVTHLFLGIRSFIWLVGMGTLFAGIVGVSNIMIIVVRERTNEIGVRKAIGATPGSIVSMILWESVIITSVAGYLGLFSGVILLEGLSYIMAISNADIEYFSHPEVNFQAAITAIIVLVISGALAGLMPAIRAARIKPIEALRAE